MSRGVAAMTTAALLALAFVVATAPRNAASRADGLRTGAAPWAPEYPSPSRRLAALHSPAQSDTAFDAHALLSIDVDGRAGHVLAQIGIDPRGRFLARLHTHDPSGIAHVESARPFPFTLKQFVPARRSQPVSAGTVTQ